MSTDAPAPPTWPRAARIRRRLSAVLSTSAFAVASLSVLTELVLVFVSPSPLLWLIPPVVSGLGVAFGYRLPWMSLILVSAAPLAAAAIGSEPTGVWSITVFIAFFLAIRNRMGLAIAVATSGANLLALSLYYGTVTFDEPIPLVAAGAALLATATGTAIRNQDAFRSSLEERAALAEAGRAAAVQSGITEERLKIARDLHDSVGHHVAVVNMHLGAAEVLLRSDLDQAASQLGLARSGVQGVLRETQSILRVLRMHDDTDAALPAVEHGAIAAHIERFRAAGLLIDATLIGLDAPLEQATSIALYRVVQECLTNAQRHGAGTLTLMVTIDDTEAVVVAENARARTTTTTGGGHGLIGMQERAESVGGTVAISREGDTFEVRVVLPVRPFQGRMPARTASETS